MFPPRRRSVPVGSGLSHFIHCSPATLHNTLHCRDIVAASAQAPACQKATIQIVLKTENQKANKKATMSESLQTRIIEHLKSEDYRPVKPRGLARELNLDQDENYHAFREALREL